MDVVSVMRILRWQSRFHREVPWSLSSRLRLRELPRDVVTEVAIDSNQLRSSFRTPSPTGASREDEGVSLGTIADKFFEEGAEKIHQQPKPLKINRDLALYRARCCRRKGIVTDDQKIRHRWFRKAEAYYRKVMRMDPTDCRAYTGLGRLFEDQKRYDDAEQIYEDGCAVSEGSNAYLWTSWGNLELKRNDVDRARSYFKAAIAANRSHEVAWHSWGKLEKSIGDVKKAKDCWMRGIRYAEHTPSPYFFQSLAQLASELRLYNQARYWYRKGTETVTGERSYVIWTAWAIMESKQGNRSLMRQLFEKSLELNPYGRYVYLSWGQVEQEDGNVDRARELFLRGHKKNRSDPALLQALAVLESDEGNLDAARKYFQKSLDLNPGYQYSWQAWGVMEARNGDTNQSRRLFQRGIWSDPNSREAAFIFQAWGLMEESVGNMDIARTLYGYGVKVNPRSEALWNAWIRLEEKAEDIIRANELRNYSMQERTEITIPENFNMIEENQNILEEFFMKVQSSIQGGVCIRMLFSSPTGFPAREDQAISYKECTEIEWRLGMHT